MPYEYDPEWFAAAVPALASNPLKNQPPPAVHDVNTLRKGDKVFIPHFIGHLPLAEDVTVSEHKVTSFDGTSIVVYQFQPTGPPPPANGPAVLHMHGGGMVAGKVMFFDRQIIDQVSRSRVPMFSVEYRLAPEHPHPIPVKDAYAALTWLHDNAEKLSIDKKRIAVMGESSGGGIAAGLALMARDLILDPPLAKQVLVMPMLDHRTIDESAFDPEFLKIGFWSTTGNITGWSALLGKDVSKESVEDVPGLQYASPARAKSLRGLPPTFIETGALDLFLWEDVEYAHRIVRDGQSLVELHVYPGAPHGYNFIGFNSELTQEALRVRIKALKSF